MDTVAGASPRQLARMAGALYLINIVGGAFAIGFVHATLFASDPATTVANIQAHQLLYRSGLAAHVVVTVTNVPLALIFYELFKVVNRRVALLAAFFILVATAIEAAGLINEFAPLVLLGNGPDASALPAAQLQALISLSSHLSGVRLHPLHRVLRARHPLSVLPCVQVEIPASSHRRTAGRRWPRLPGLQLHGLPGARRGR